MPTEETRPDDWEVTKEIRNIWAKANEELRQRDRNWIREWRELKPTYKGKQIAFAELVYGALTGEGVKYAPIYLTEDGVHVALYIVTTWGPGHDYGPKSELWMTKNERDYILGEIDIEEVKERGYGKIQTMEEFLSRNDHP